MIDDKQLPVYAAALLRLISNDPSDVAGVLVCAVAPNGDVFVAIASDLGGVGVQAIARAAEHQIQDWVKAYIIAGGDDPEKMN